MNAKTTIEGNKVTLELEGKLTVQTLPDMSSIIDELPENICDVDVDLDRVSYIASAGLRTLVALDKMAASRGGVMRILHPRAEVMEVFEMTGLHEVFTIEA